MENQQIEQGLAHMKATLTDLDQLIDLRKKRMAELKPLLAEAKSVCQDIGRLKKHRRAIADRIDWLVEFFRTANGGQFPDGMFPLFAKQSEEAA